MAQKYLHKKYHAFLAHVIDKKKDEKNIKDIPEVCNFLGVFPDDLPGVPPKRQVEFRIKNTWSHTHSQVAISISSDTNARTVQSAERTTE